MGILFEKQKAEIKKQILDEYDKETKLEVKRPSTIVDISDDDDIPVVEDPIPEIDIEIPEPTKPKPPKTTSFIIKKKPRRRKDV